jgi:hypothetical protein
MASVDRFSSKPVTPGEALMAGEVVGYLLTVAYAHTFGPIGSASTLLSFPSVAVVFVLAIVIGLIYEVHVYKRFSDLPTSDAMDVLMEHELRVEARLGRSPWWQLLAAGLIGVLLGFSLAGAVQWAHA